MVGDSMRYTLPLFPAPSRARPEASNAMAYTTSWECPHARRGTPSGSMRYTSLPPATPIGAVDGGGVAGCRAPAALPATAAATCAAPGTVGTSAALAAPDGGCQA